MPAIDAFEWCVDYDQGDLDLMGEIGRRKIMRVSDNSVLLVDSYRGEKAFTKKKLVHLFPEKLFWTSVHVSGPAKYSQFLYQITEEGKNRSSLEFTGFQVVYSDKAPTRSEISLLAKKLVSEDSATWKKLASAMERDLPSQSKKS